MICLLERTVHLKKLKNCLWLHGASLGECRVLMQVALRLKTDLPEQIPVLITTQKAEVFTYLKSWKHSLNETQIEVSIAPLPISFFVKKFYKSVNPKAILFCENELWPAYLQIKKYDPSVFMALISGRFLRSERIPQKILPLENLSFASFQTEEDAKAFQKKLGKYSKIKKRSVAGNWKLFGKKLYENQENRKIDLAFVSLHFKEWKHVQNLAKNELAENKTLLFAPRRSEEIPLFKKAFSENQILFTDYPELKKNHISIVNTFGILPTIFPKTENAIVGGSFIRSGVHDFLEPLTFGVKTFIGNKTYGAKNLAKEFIRHKIIMQLDAFPEELGNPEISSSEIFTFLKEKQNLLEKNYSDLLEALKKSDFFNKIEI